MSTKRVLGVDPGTGICGFGVVEFTTHKQPHMVTAGIGGKLNFAEYLGQLPERQPVGFVVAVVVVAVQRRYARAEEVLYRAVAILKVKENVVMPHKFFKFLRGFRCVVILIQAVLRVLIRV